MTHAPTTWRNTTHDWAASVDHRHLAEVRERVAEFAPGGALHLILEAMADPAEEAASRGQGRCLVVLHRNGSVTVSDDGRGTDTRLRPDGTPVRKPVVATQDLRFFAAASPPALPDGHPRRGMSVVAALSSRLVHVNRRQGGAWCQAYEHGIPVTGLDPVDDDGTTGTTITFVPDPAVHPGVVDLGPELGLLTSWQSLDVEVADERPISRR